MKKVVWTGALVAAGVLLASGSAFAQQSQSKTVDVNVEVLARARLDLGTGVVNFLDADPDAFTSQNAAPFTVDVKARTSRLGTVRLDVGAPDFSDGAGGTIAIGDLSYAAGGGGFTNGPFTVAAASAGSWTGSGYRFTMHTYTMANRWGYNVGNYATTVTYTLTAP